MEIDEYFLGKNHGKLAHLRILAPKIFHDRKEKLDFRRHAMHVCYGHTYKMGRFSASSRICI